jgi:hypothetical protein
MGDERERRDDEARRRRADVYSSARIGAASALTLVLVVLLVLDVAVPGYDVSPAILLRSSARSSRSWISRPRRSGGTSR